MTKPTRFLTIAILIGGLAAPCAAQDELPLLSTLEKNIPTAEALIAQVEPLDWVVLKKSPDGEHRVLVVEAISGRPTTIADAETKKQRFIEVIIPQARETEFKLFFSQVDRIIYAEELMLRRADMLMAAGDIETAFELISLVERRIPKWDQTVPRLQKLLFRDAEIKLSKKEPELALALLEECFQLNAEFPGVNEKVGQITDDLVGKAVADQNYRKAQHFLDRCGETFPDHPVRQKWVRQLTEMSDTNLRNAVQAFDRKDFPTAANEAQEANRIWRVSGQRQSTYSRILSRYQQLHVGVTSVGQEFPVTSFAAKRQYRLRAATLFEPTRADSVAYYDTDFFEQWEPLDLGRRAVFTLRQNKPSWQPVPLITSPNIIDTLSARLDPKNPAYDERFASYIKSFLVRSPHEFEIRFSRIPLRVESLFDFPITKPNGELFSEKFRIAEEEPDRKVFRRAILEPDGLSASQYHVAEVIEHRFEHSHEAIQALLRNEVQMVPHLAPWEVDAFESNQAYFLRKYALPNVHLIQFNPKTELLNNVQVRRALSKSIDRKRILQKTVLRDSTMRHGRVVAAPWPSPSYANSSLVELPKYDLAGLRTAAALRSTAEMILKTDEEREKEAKEGVQANQKPRTKELPTLRLVLEQDPMIRQAAPEIIKFWVAAGFKVRIVDSTNDPDQWDLVYHKVKMIEPVIELWPLLTLRDKARIDDMLSLPDWLKQELIDLDFTGNFTSATEHLRLLHRHLAAQAFFIPLWEIDDYAVYSISMSGFSEQPVTPYQGISRWAVKPSPGR